jgi:hypothetical protein
LQGFSEGKHGKSLRKYALEAISHVKVELARLRP